MAAAALTAAYALQHIVRKEMSFTRRDLEPEVDGIFSRLYSTSMGVERRAGIGSSSSGWQVNHTFVMGVAGGFVNVSPAGPSTLKVNTSGTGWQTRAWDSSTVRTFPTMAQMTTPGYVQKTITLCQGMGNFQLPFHYFQSDRLSESISEAVGHVIRGNAKLVNQTEANSFYTNAYGAIMTVVDESETTIADGPAADYSITITIDGTNTTGRIARFYPGMLLDHYSSDNVQKNAASHIGATEVVVMDVDYVNKKVSIGSLDSSHKYCHDAGGTDIADGDYFVPREEAQNYGIYGPEYWLANSGTVFGIALANYPQLNSLVGAVNAPLEEVVLNKYVGGFFDAYGGLYDLDTLITTAGVLTNYMSNVDGLYRYARNGSRLTLREGWASMDYAYNGRDFDILVSRYQTSGQAYILKTGGGNLKKYIPPTVEATVSKDGYPNDIQFVGPWYGSNTIFVPERTSTGALTEFVNAPYLYFRAVCPESIPGIKLTGLSETNP